MTEENKENKLCSKIEDCYQLMEKSGWGSLFIH